MKEYRSICQSRGIHFLKEKFALIENSLTDSKTFWENWKNRSEMPSTLSKSNIGGKIWYEHFSKLHTETKNKTVPNTPIDIMYSSNVLDLNDPFTYK